MSIYRQALSGSVKKIACDLEQSLEIMLDDYLWSKIYIFSQFIWSKSKYWQSHYKVQSSGFSLASACCCYFYLSWRFLCAADFAWARIDLYSKYIYFRYQNTEEIVSYRYCFPVYPSKCRTLRSIFSSIIATVSADLSDCTKYTLTKWITVRNEK